VVGRAIVGLYHGAGAAHDAETAFDRRFKRHEVPEDIPERPLPRAALNGDGVYLPRVLAELGLAASGSEARRLIAQGGVRLDGEVVSDDTLPAQRVRGAVLQVGRRRFVRITP
jgi:tyrosyl-tRNA synthetase